MGGNGNTEVQILIEVNSNLRHRFPILMHCPDVEILPLRTSKAFGSLGSIVEESIKGLYSLRWTIRNDVGDGNTVM